MTAVRADMIDATLVGRTFPPHSADIEAGRLRLFAKATGETRPEYCDEAAARSAGHRSLPAPPTFTACLCMDVPDPFGWLRDLGVDVARVLHGAQALRFFKSVYAGDRLTFASRIDDVLRKKAGALTFIVTATDITNQTGLRVAEVRSTIVVRAPDEPPRSLCSLPPEEEHSALRVAARALAAASGSYKSINVGDELPRLSLPPLTRTTLALYAGASGDHNPIHTDIDFARAAGMPDVFAHGMLSMAWLGRMLTAWVPQRDLREFGVRFTAMTHVGERIVCTGRVVEKLERDGERLVRVSVATANEAGEIKLSGEALVVAFGA